MNRRPSIDALWPVVVIAIIAIAALAACLSKAFWPSPAHAADWPMIGQEREKPVIEFKQLSPDAMRALEREADRWKGCPSGSDCRNLRGIDDSLNPFQWVFDDGQYEGVDPKTRAWFKSVRSPHGVPCCDISDGHVTTWQRKPGDDHYWVPIEGELRQVPTESVITQTSHPEGETVVWYVRQGPDSVYIRCFVPGRGV